MTDSAIDQATMGRLAKALVFICGADNTATKALARAAETGAPGDVKKARALFLKLKSSERFAALAMLEDD